MRLIYISIVCLVLYGDLVKRILPAEYSLITLYLLAVIVLVAITLRSKLQTNKLSNNGKILTRLAILLIGIYAFQVLTTFNGNLNYALTHAIYICVPLLYLVILLKFCHKLDINVLAHYFLVLIIPINIVGLIQYFVDPTFLISINYSGEQGGIVYRNYLEGGEVFSRYPSIFASAHRYSAMALMQVYFSIVLIAKNKRELRSNIQWILFCLASGWISLFIAGARSKILIALISMILLVVIIIVQKERRQNTKRNQLALVFSLLTAMIGIFYFGFISPMDLDNDNIFPVLKLFQQSIETGELNNRVGYAVNQSLLSDSTTFLGKGLGTIGKNGKPGEFGIMSIWQESGLILGLVMVMIYMAIVGILLAQVYKFFICKKNRFGALLYFTPSAVLTLSLFAGLTGAFELSMGVILFSSIAASVNNEALYDIN